MNERWVNAIIEVVIPLDVSPDAPDTAKQLAAGDAVDLIGIPDSAVVGARWETVEDVEGVAEPV